MARQSTARCNWHGAIGTVQLRNFDTLLIHLRDTFLGQYLSMLFYAFLCFCALQKQVIRFQSHFMSIPTWQCRFQQLAIRSREFLDFWVKNEACPWPDSGRCPCQLRKDMERLLFSNPIMIYNAIRISLDWTM